ncbi:MAG: hypothetical protein ACLUD2_11700 [Clostridium sp.]
MIDKRKRKDLWKQEISGKAMAAAAESGAERRREKNKKEQQREHLDPLNPEKETPEKQEEKNAGRKIAVAVGGAVLTAAVAAGAVYVGMGQKYKRVYFPNTTINGLDVSGLTPDEVKSRSRMRPAAIP